MLKRLYTLYHPEVYHRPRGAGSSFEGWFYKVTDSTSTHVYAIIPGICIDAGHRDDHAFIQFLDAGSHASSYLRFAAAEFSAGRRPFSITIGPNRFTLEGLSIDLRTPERRIAGMLKFHHHSRWPVRPLSPGAMGWYSFVPSMECYHGVLSMDHAISGTLNASGSTITFDGGRGYLEKDWGTAFPSAYVWMQCNHFMTPRTALMVSIARIPWRGRSFRGFIIGFLFQGRLHRFATYNSATLEYVTISDREVRLAVCNRRFRLAVTAERTSGGVLHAPDGWQMSRRISETLTSRVAVRFSRIRTDKDIPLFEESAGPAGLDINGGIREITDPH